MKMKKIIFTIFACIPFLIFVGFSTWIIMYEVAITPDYIPNELSQYFGVSQQTEYNSLEQAPRQIAGDAINESLISYKYKLATDTEYIDGKPIWAGTYDVIVTVQDIGSCSVKYTINKKPIRLQNPIAEFNYFTGLDSSKLSKSHMGNIKPEIDKNIVFVDNENNVIDKYLDIERNEWEFTQKDYAYSYSSITNGNMTFSVDSTETIPGSTYQVKIELGEDITRNYEFTGPNYLIVKYKSAITNGIYYTIEDAIKNQKGFITFLGDKTNENSYVETQFCSLTTEQGYPYTNFTSETIEGKQYRRFDVAVTMYVPYDASNTIFAQSSSKSNLVYAALTIPENVHLNISNNVDLNVCGSINYTMPNNGYIPERGVIMNNGRITVQSGSELYAYGHVKGVGTVYVNSGGKVYDVMRIYDWPGGSDAMSLVSSGFPILLWTAHSISCPLIIYKGAELYAVAVVEVSVVGAQKANACVIGASSSTSECMFRPAASAKSTDYIYKAGYSEGNEINTSIKMSNQTVGQRDIIKIYGDYTDNTFKVSVSLASFSSSTKKPCPFAYQDITVCSGSSLAVSKSSYAFIAGSSLTIEKDAVVDVGSGAYIVFDTYDSSSGKYGLTQYIDPQIINKTDAILTVNGTLSGAGSIGGKVVTKAEGSVLTVGTKITAITLREGIAGAASMNSSIASSSAPYLATGSIGTKDGFSENVNFSDQTTTTFIGTTLNNIDYFFTSAPDVKTFTLNFKDPEQGNKNLGSVTIYVVKTDESGKYSYTITGNEFSASKLHKDIDYWKRVDSSNSSGYSNALDYVLYNGVENTIDLYAVWKEHSYSFYYSSGHLSKDADDGKPTDASNFTSYSNILNNFTISNFVDGVLNITTTASYEGKIFTGWFVGTMDNHLDVEISSITIEDLENFIEETGLDTIPLYCEFIDGYEYTLSFIDGRDDIDVSVDNQKLYDQETIYLPKTSSIDTNPDKDKYCTGWYIENEGEKIYLKDGAIFVLANYINYADANRVIQVHAEWTSKTYTVNYYNHNNEVKKQHFFNEGQSVTIYDGKSDDNYLKPETTTPYGCIYTFDGWSKTSNSEVVDYVSNQNYKENASLNLYSHYSTNYYYNLSITVSGAYVTINGTDYKSNTTIRYDNLTSPTASVTIKYVVTRTSNKGLQVTQGGNQVCSEQASTYNGTYTLNGSHGSINAKGTNDCITADSLITLYDGSQKRVDELTSDDLLLVWNHETGCLDFAPAVFLIHQQESEDLYKIINLIFSNGTEIKIIGEHGLFDVSEKKYVYINESNINNFIGHSFLYTEIATTISNVKLIDYYISYEVTKKYSPITFKHMNCFVDGILTITNFTNAFVNYFELDEEFKYDIESMKKDIEKYGLYTYDDWKNYMTYEAFLTFNGEYVKVSVGKGQTTEEEIIELIEMFLKDNNIIGNNSH